MKIAIPDTNGNVSPRFETCNRIKIFESDTDAANYKEKTIEVSDLSPFEKARLLRKEGVDSLICLGIENWIYHYLTGFNIRVVFGVSGKTAEIAEDFLKGKIHRVINCNYSVPVIMKRRGRWHHGHCKRGRYRGRW